MTKKIKLSDLKESDYVDRWVTLINEDNETVHYNDVLGLEITMLNITEEEIESRFKVKNKTD